jgi:hypothetical protein
MKTLIALVVVATLAKPAMAFDTSDADTLNGLAAVIAAEKPCAMKCDQAAIKSFIDERVKIKELGSKLINSSALTIRS